MIRPVNQEVRVHVRSRFEIPVAMLANGHEFALHVHEIVADSDGPTVLVVAGIMGDQPTGVEIVRRAAALLETEETMRSGRVLLLPVANPYAYQQHMRHTPLDMNNLNRVFPGRENGLLTEQVAAAISGQLLAGTDVLVALHSGGAFETTRYVYAFDDMELAASFGAELVLPGPSYPGTIALAARERGVRVVVSELGGHARTADSIESGLRGLTNVFRHLEMAEGEPELPKLQTYCPDISVLRPRSGGILLSAFSAEDLGSRIPRGATLGEIVSPYTFETLETITAPFEPSLLALTREPVTHIEAGDYGFIVADGATAHPITLSRH